MATSYKVRDARDLERLIEVEKLLRRAQEKVLALESATGRSRSIAVVEFSLDAAIERIHSCADTLSVAVTGKLLGEEGR